MEMVLALAYVAEMECTMDVCRALLMLQDASFVVGVIFDSHSVFQRELLRLLRRWSFVDRADKFDLYSDTGRLIRNVF